MSPLETPSDTQDQGPKAEANSGSMSGCWVVGIGSSAGGLEALSAFLRPLPAGLPAAVVVVQHMSATHRSLLTQLLARETALTVVEIEEGMRPQLGTVHVAPSRMHVELRNGAFELFQPGSARVPTPSVDRFFMSLADHCGARAIAVVLSGTGRDGTQGLRAVKLAGGHTYVQDPASARYDGMPVAAIETGMVDTVLPIEQLGDEVARLVTTDVALPVAPQPPQSSMAVLLELVRKQTGVDLSGYKENTIQRRLARRMAARHTILLEDYVRIVREDPTELERLLQEALISVTAFFRDPPAFQALAPIAAEIVAKRLSEEEIRVWVAGCATGEEAYSISIVFAEAMAHHGHVAPRLRIFATDIDTRALQIARRGVYPAAALTSLPPVLRERYFSETPQGMEVKRSIREPITFARHDLCSDPPFLRSNLICCRNLLIYFQPSLQAKVFPLLRHAMGTPGYLFLGKSESASQFPDQFEPAEKAAHIYRACGPRLPTGVMSLPPSRPEKERTTAPRPPSLADVHMRALLELYAPPSVLVDRSGAILHSMGDLSAYLSFPVGQPDLNIGAVVRHDLGAMLRSMLHRAIRTRTAASGPVVEVKNGQHFRMSVQPTSEANQNHYLVAFLPVKKESLALSPSSEEERATEPTEVQTLREELMTTRENLQTLIEELETSNEEMQALIEELETSNEEMQALNEELQSTNEELQSTNGELETSNEEMQSTNEELNTVNDELQRASHQVAEANADLLSLLQSLSHPVLLFDESLRLSRFNEAAAQQLHIPLKGVGLAIDQLPIPAAIAELRDWLTQTLASGEPLERQFSEGGRHFTLTAQVCSVPSHQPRGLLVQVHDVSVFINTQLELSQTRSLLESILDHSAMGFVIADSEGRIDFVSKTMAQWLRHKKPALLGSLLWSHFQNESAQQVHQAHSAALVRTNTIEIQEQLTVRDSAARQLLSIRVPLTNSAGQVRGVCWEVLDISERERVREAFSASEALSQAVLTAMPASIAVLDAQGLIVSVNDAWLRFAQDNGCPDSYIWKGQSYLQHCGPDPTPESEAVLAGIRSVLEGRNTLFSHDYPCHSPHQQRWFRMMVSRLPVSAGGAAVLHVDITQSVQAQQALQKLNADLEAKVESRTRYWRQAADELDMFSFSVSHDLRSPLRTLSGFSEILLAYYADQLDSKGQSHLRSIAAAAMRMGKYLDELLKLSHLARGELLIADIDLTSMAREIGQAELSRIGPDRRVEFSVAEGLHDRGDLHLIRSVLENLIGNAFKYSRSSNPARIEVGKTWHDNQEMFYVRDNGMGFDMAYSDKLFMPFQRLHTDHQLEGSGIGLAAARRIIVRHGGMIEAEARPGLGATFYFCLG